MLGDGVSLPRLLRRVSALGTGEAISGDIDPRVLARTKSS